MAAPTGNGLELLALAVRAPGIVGKKLPCACGLFAQGLYAGLAFGLQGVVCAALILGQMQGHDLVGSLFQPISAVPQLFLVSLRSLPALKGNLTLSNGEHVPANQPLGIAGHQDLAEQRFDLGTKPGNEFGDMDMAGLAACTDGDELDVALARLFNGSA